MATHKPDDFYSPSRKNPFIHKISGVRRFTPRAIYMTGNYSTRNINKQNFTHFLARWKVVNDDWWLTNEGASILLTTEMTSAQWVSDSSFTTHSHTRGGKFTEENSHEKRSLTLSLFFPVVCVMLVFFSFLFLFFILRFFFWREEIFSVWREKDGRKIQNEK